MNTSKALAVALSIGLTSFAATSQTTADHAQHTAGAAASAAPAATELQVSAMDKHLQHMRDMSNKMAEAKTAQERQALMAEHKKAMHDGMKMMDGHRAQAGGMGSDMMQRHTMMEKRMEMMQTMMQMMMDHMHPPVSK